MFAQSVVRSVNGERPDKFGDVDLDFGFYVEQKDEEIFRRFLNAISPSGTQDHRDLVYRLQLLISEKKDEIKQWLDIH